MNALAPLRPSLIRPHCIAPVLVLMIAVLPLAAQESLKSMVEEAGAGWMIGEWTGTNAQGQAVSLEYEWDLNGHLIELDLKLGAAAYTGMIHRDPSNGEARETGVSTDGGVTRATWRVEDGAVISERIATRPDGREIRVAVVNRRVDADTVRATVHSISADGTWSEAPIDSVTLRRVPASGADD